MRWKPLVLVVSLAGVPALAEEKPQTSVVQRDYIATSEVVKAATNNAVDALYKQIAEMPLGPRLTVGLYLKEMELQDQFNKALRQADQIGAPRWIDEYTCQVQLEIPARRATLALQRFAAGYPRASSVTPQQIATAAAAWPRSFMATGSSASHVALVQIKPVMGQQWARVDAATRREALQAASDDAATRAMDSVSPILLSNSKTIGDVLAIPEINQSVRTWLLRRPINRVDFGDDLQVKVALAVDQQDFYSIIRQALARQTTIQLPGTPDDWQRVEHDFMSRFREPVGQAKAAVEAPAPAPKPAIELPERPPEWVMDRINVQGSSKASGPRLKTARAAENDALAKLQTRMEELRLDDKTTLGEAARKDPRIADAIVRAIQQATIFKTVYQPDGTVVIHLSADMRDLWEELHR